jgi:hypothetical protein
MASEVKTNKISPSTSTTVTLGDASDLFQLPASAEIDIASGATLDVNGIIDLTGATKTGFPAGGLTQFSQWRLTTDFAGDAAPIVSNLVEVASPVGFGKLPDEAAGGANSMALNAGVFTFPSTGYWLITFNPLWYTTEANAYLNGQIYTTPDDSAYSEAARASTSANDGTAGSTSATGQYIFDVTSTSTHKVKFNIDIAGSTATCLGNAAFNETHITFMKLADA